MNTELQKFIKIKDNKKIFSIFYLGQEGVIMNLNNTTFCIDPYLSDFVDKNCSTKIIKWQRKYPAKINGSNLNFVNYFLFTHTHYDHCDPWTIRDILKTNKLAKFIIGVNNVRCLIKYGVPRSRIIPISVNKPLLINKVKIYAYPAKHDVFHRFHNEYNELCFALIYHSFKVFHAGDTLNYPELFKHMINSNVSFLPINGRDAFRSRNDIIGNLSPYEAFDLALKSHTKLLIPTHNDLYQINCSSDKEVKNVINKFKSVKYLLIKHNNYFKVNLNE